MSELMRTMQIKYPYIAIDLDGTLLNSNKKINMPDYHAIRLYTEMGGHIILATGRSPLSTEWIAENLQIDKSFVSFNGSYFQSKSKCYGFYMESSFSCKELDYLLTITEQFGLEFIMYSRDIIYIEELTPLNARWLNELLDFSYLPVHSNPDVYSQRLKIRKGIIHSSDLSNIIKFVILPNKEVEFESAFSALHSMSFSLNKTDRYIEITKDIYNKGDAIRKILENTGYSISDIMAIGDNYNDLSMLLPAKLGIVVDNSLPEIKMQIEHVTASNNNNGVAEAIIKYAFC